MLETIAELAHLTFLVIATNHGDIYSRNIVRPNFRLYSGES